MPSHSTSESKIFLIFLLIYSSTELHSIGWIEMQHKPQKTVCNAQNWAIRQFDRNRRVEHMHLMCTRRNGWCYDPVRNPCSKCNWSADLDFESPSKATCIECQPNDCMPYQLHMLRCPTNELLQCGKRQTFGATKKYAPNISSLGLQKSIELNIYGISCWYFVTLFELSSDLCLIDYAHSICSTPPYCKPICSIIEPYGEYRKGQKADENDDNFVAISSRAK